MPVTIEMKPSEKEQPRATMDRRQFSYTHYIPERRCGRERRHDDDSAVSSNDSGDNCKQNGE